MNKTGKKLTLNSGIVGKSKEGKWWRSNWA